MDRETISRIVRCEIEKFKKNDHLFSNVNSSLSSYCSLPLALLLSEPRSRIGSKLEGKLRAANFNPVTDASIAGDARILVLTDLSHKNLSHICDGIDEGDFASAVIEGILTGKEIILIEEGIKYKSYSKSSNKNFYEMMQKKERLLISYGVKIMKEKCFIDYIETNFSLSNSADEKNGFNGKLMTEEHARFLCKSGVFNLILQEGVIITPLAQDYIRENNMSVSYRGH